KPAPIWACLAPWLMLLAFCGYYFIFLNQFETHRVLQRVWTIPWTIGWPTWIRSHALVGALAAWRIARERRISGDLPFLLAAMSVSLVLANHHWLIQARQPAHFSR